MAAPTLLTVHEAAGTLGYSVDTINRLRREGAIRGVRPTGGRGHWRYDASELDRFVKARKAEERAPVLPLKQPRRQAS